MPKIKKKTKAKVTKKKKTVTKEENNQQSKVQLKANNQFCSILHATFFDKTQCKAITDQAVEELWMSGETIGGGVNKKVRHVEQQVLPINEKGGHYDWHVDTGNEVCHRKLSFTIQLSDSKDYKGGDIEFIGSKVDKEAFRQRGVCIIYPSFLPHRITKVTKGVRHAIVGWIHGPTFR